MTRLQKIILPIASGRYVIAVSGGVDSMVLLDMLRQDASLELIVAHVDHGIRPDSNKDCDLVAEYAARHALIFESTRLNLGIDASEDEARQQRYAFLRQCRKKHDAKQIIVAHHQEDLIETVIIAIIRGTGWRGLAPFVNPKQILRPLLNATKSNILGYARANNIAWREDSTNQNQKYLRNYVRLGLIPLLDQKSESWREDFLQMIRKQQSLRFKIEEELLSSISKILDKNTLLVKRYCVIMAPAEVAYEIVQQIFRNCLGTSVERQLAEAAVLFIKVARPNKILQLNKNWQLRVLKTDFVVERRTSW